MKKLISLIISLMLLISMLAGCSDNDDDSISTSYESSSSESASVSSNDEIYNPTPQEYIDKLKLVFDKATISDIKTSSTEYSFDLIDNFRVSCLLNNEGRVKGVLSYLIGDISTNEDLAQGIVLIVETAMALMKFQKGNFYSTTTVCSRIATSFTEGSNGVKSTGNLHFAVCDINIYVYDKINTLMLTCNLDNSNVASSQFASSAADSSKASSNESSSDMYWGIDDTASSQHTSANSTCDCGGQLSPLYSDTYDETDEYMCVDCGKITTK